MLADYLGEQSQPHGRSSEPRGRATQRSAAVPPPGGRSRPRATTPAEVEHESAAWDEAAAEAAYNAGVRADSESRALVVSHESAPPRILVQSDDLRDGTITDPNLPMLVDPDGPQAAAYRILRYRLAGFDDKRAIIISSALPGPEKSVCAINLALALSEHRANRVLLIQADYAAPYAAEWASRRPSQALARQLALHRQLPQDPWEVTELAPYSLHLVPTVREASPVPVLDVELFQFAIKKMRAANYDYILIDAPPVLGCSEVNAMQAFCDGIVLTAAKGRSRAKDLKACIEQLGPNAVLGIALHE